MFFLKFFSLCLPVFVALTGIVITYVAYGNSTSQIERRLNRRLLCLLLSLAGAWAGLFMLFLLPDFFYAFFPFYTFAVLSIPVCLYLYIYSIYGKQTKTSLWLHAAIPAMAAVVVYVFPRLSDNVLALTGSTGVSLARLTVSLAYTILTLRLLSHYRRKKQQSEEQMSQRAYRQAVILIVLTFTQLANGILMAISSPGKMTSIIWVIVVGALLISVLSAVLLYNAICRDFVLPVKREKSRKVKLETETYKKPQKRRLSRQVFESVVVDGKLYLRPGLSLVELAALLNIGRNPLSAFVNREYGMNFSCYINQLRLNEFERLRSLPGGHIARTSEVAVMCGFGNYQAYLRARKERDEKVKITVKPKRKEKGSDADE